MDNTRALAITKWLAERESPKRGVGTGKLRATVEIAGLTEIRIKQCPNRRYYSAQLHRYVQLREVCVCFERGIPVTIVTRDGADVTLSSLLYALADRVRTGELIVTVEKLRELIR